MATAAYRLALSPGYPVFMQYSMSPCSGSTLQIQLIEWIGVSSLLMHMGPVRIMDSRDQVLRRKIVRLVKVLWKHRGVEEATWECEDTMRATYPSLFEDEGTLFSHLKKKRMILAKFF